MLHPQGVTPQPEAFTFIPRQGLPPKHSHMLDSLVRVTRRVVLQDHVKLHNDGSYRVPWNRGTCPKVVPQNGKNSQITSLMPHSIH